MLFEPPITASLSPNSERDDIFLAAKLLFQPWNWKYGSGTQDIINWFSDTFKTPHVFLYNSGRSALFQILQAFGITQGDEVIVQSFSCVAVSNSILWNNATPVYCDIDEQYNLSLHDIQKKITSRTKAIIVQHTFGIPADIETLVVYAKKHNIVVIEDCAHSLGATYKGKLLGTWADAAIFSFGRDKVLSSVFGGVAIISPAHIFQAQSLFDLHRQLPINNYWWILRQLVHPIFFSIILPVYRIGIGKVILRILQILGILSFPVYPMEKEGKRPGDFPAKYPNALAILGMNQLKKLSRYNQVRQKVAAYYRKQLENRNDIVLPRESNGAIYLRYPIRVKNSLGLIRQLRKKGILLGDWYSHGIDPKGTNFRAIGYTPNSCPHAQSMTNGIVNLPTLISVKQAGIVIAMIKYFL